MADTSILIVREFPRTLRQQIHARAALEGKFIHEVIIGLLERALASPEDVHWRKDELRSRTKS